MKTLTVTVTYTRSIDIQVPDDVLTAIDRNDDSLITTAIDEALISDAMANADLEWVSTMVDLDGTTIYEHG